MRTIYLVLKEDIIYYPPVLSIINVLLELGIKVVHIGDYSDSIQKDNLMSRGVEFLPTIKYRVDVSPLRKVYQLLKFKSQVNSYLNDRNISGGDYIWIFKSENLCLLDNLVFKYNTIIHQFEFENPKLNWKYRMMNPFFSMSKAFLAARKVISCEYNRAQITKGLLNLKEMPFVLPNKPYIPECDLSGGVPDDVANLVSDIECRIKDKKVILYQGVFLEDRNLEEFCQAMEHMTDDYRLLLMGGESDMYRDLKRRYNSDKIIFVPFIKPPYHLLITKLAHIGVLSYVPSSTNFADVVNPLYCAPNKIFEYTKFGIPMLANDIPGLYYIFLEFQCGVCLKYPILPSSIKDTVTVLFNNYDSFSKNARRYYESVDLKDSISKLLQ